MPNVLQPLFTAAYPQFTFKYVGSATGAAIQSAEGTGSTADPSVLIVHAASLENQFVASGYSYNNQYGNAIFRNDFVLAGPNSGESGKANVASNAANNVAQAFADVATAGVAGKATYISRGGTTTASGTTVEEHAIWQLAYQAGLLPTSVVVCAVSTADGGGMTPISATVQATSNQACPDSGSVSSTDVPSWYVIDNVAQAAALTATNSCTVGNGAGTCYMLTDRGTFDYLSNGGTASGGTTTIKNLAIVTRNNSASAPGGRYALINYFHAYIINPSAAGEQVNLTAAQDFVNFLTSPTVQSQVNQYLANTSDTGGAPFVADASPIITAAGLPSTVAAGQSVTVSGNVANAEIGYPTLAGESVAVDEVSGVTPVPVAGATATTDSNGNYSITFTPPSTGSYQVVTSQLSQIENPSLSPIYGDILSPGASAATTITVQQPTTTPTGAVTLTTVKGDAGTVSVSGAISPAAPDTNGQVAILARKVGSTGAFTVVGGTVLNQGSTVFSTTASVAAGNWEVEALYTDPGKVVSATSATKVVTVLSTSTSAGLSKSKASKGKVTVTGTLSQAAPAKGTVELFAVATAKLKAGKFKAGKFKVVAKVSIKAGKRSYTIKTKLARGYRYELQLAFVQKGKTTTFSRLSSLNVS